jgi:hypothetical protein
MVDVVNGEPEVRSRFGGRPACMNLNFTASCLLHRFRTIRFKV